MSLNLTINGLYKATHLNEYLCGEGQLESGGLLYYPALKYACLSLNTFGKFNTYETVVLFNGFCGAILSSALFLYSYQMWRSTVFSLLITAAHFFIPSVFFVAVSNEDIFPAYTLYVLGLLSLTSFFKQEAPASLVLSVVLFSVSMLLHWTMGIPTFLALYLFLLFYPCIELKNRLKFVVIGLTVQSVTFLLFSAILDASYLRIWYPAKASDSLWISGINLDNLPLVIYNSLAFFAFGKIASSLDQLEKNLLTIIPLTPILLVLTYAGFRILKGYRSSLFTQVEVRTLIYLILVFCIGTGMNWYEQGYDPQFLIQPLLFFLFLLVMFTKLISRKSRNLVLRGIIIFSLFIITQSVSTQYKRDVYSWENLEKIKQRTGNLERTLLIGSGFEDIYATVLYDIGSWRKTHFLHLPHGVISDITMSNEEYLRMAKDSIETYVANGYEIVLIDFINKQPEDLGKKFNTYDVSDKMALVQAYLRNNYEVDEITGVHRNNFYHLEPKFEIDHIQNPLNN